MVLAPSVGGGVSGSGGSEESCSHCHIERKPTEAQRQKPMHPQASWPGIVGAGIVVFTVVCIGGAAVAVGCGKVKTKSLEEP